jgi:hypothetical protein
VIAESAVRSFPIEENKEPQVCQSLLCNLVSGIGNCGRAKLFGSRGPCRAIGVMINMHTLPLRPPMFERNNTISLVHLGTYPCPKTPHPHNALRLSFKPKPTQRNCSAYEYNLIIQPRPRTVRSAHKLDRECHTGRCIGLNLKSKVSRIDFCTAILTGV